MAAAVDPTASGTYLTVVAAAAVPAVAAVAAVASPVHKSI